MKLTGESLMKFVEQNVIFCTRDEAIGKLEKRFKTKDIDIFVEEERWVIRVKNTQVTIVAG